MTGLNRDQVVEILRLLCRENHVRERSSIIHLFDTAVSRLYLFIILHHYTNLSTH